MIKKVSFNTDDELNEEISQLEKEYVLKFSFQPKVSVITIYPTKWPYISKFEAWIRLERKNES